MSQKGGKQAGKQQPAQKQQPQSGQKQQQQGGNKNTNNNKQQPGQKPQGGNKNNNTKQESSSPKQQSGQKQQPQSGQKQQQQGGSNNNKSTTTSTSSSSSSGPKSTGVGRGAGGAQKGGVGGSGGRGGSGRGFGSGGARGSGGRGGGSSGFKGSGDKKEKRKPIIEKGIVMSVPSGDRLIVYIIKETRSSRWSAPPKKEVKISWIEAPKSSARWIKDNEENVRETEPFAWASRNYLRQLCIGKPVELNIVSKPEDQKERREIPRVLAAVTLKDKDGDIDLSTKMVEEGWATVKTPTNTEKIPKRLEELLALQGAARKQGIGIHNSDAKEDNLQEQIREFDNAAQFQKWKGKKESFSGIVEAVISGSYLIITLLPSMLTIRFKISGVRCPRDDEDFGAEAKYTTERYTLHRDCKFTITSFDRDRPPVDSDEEEEEEESDTNKKRKPRKEDLSIKTGVFHGELFIQDASIGELLLQSGLAEMEEWSTLATKRDKYRQFQAEAQKKKARIWSDAERLAAALAIAQEREATAAAAAAAAAVGSSAEPIVGGTRSSWLGRVLSIQSGSTLVIEGSDKKHTPEKITLSSIKVPMNYYDERPDEPLAFEARECLRKRAIGKVARVILDYTVPEREEVNTDTNEKKIIPAKSFYTVEVNKKNLALELVSEGLATVLETKGNRKSQAYDELLVAQGKSKQRGLGLHTSKKETLVKRHFNDLTRQPAKQAKAVYKQLVGKQPAVVEYVASGHRMKVLFPTHNMLGSVQLEGVRCFAVPPKAKEGEKQRETPPFAAEALDFAKQFCYQQDVEVEIVGQTTAGTFKVFLFKNKEMLNTLLLAEGLGRPAPAKKYHSEIEAAVAIAKEKNKGVWEGYEQKQKIEAKQNVELSEPIKVLVEVTEVLDASWFFAIFKPLGQEEEEEEEEEETEEGEEKKPKKKKALKLEDVMKKISELKLDGKEPAKAANGEVVLAKFSGDKTWYRALVKKVLEKENQVKVFFGDYGNTDVISADDIRELPEEFNLEALAFQSRECSLAYIRSLRFQTEQGERAAVAFKDFVWGKQILGSIEYRAQGKFYLSLWDESKTYINAELVKEGLARVDRQRKGRRGAEEKTTTPNHKDVLLNILAEAEDEAHDNHRGLWYRGDPGSDEEHED